MERKHAILQPFSLRTLLALAVRDPASGRRLDASEPVPGQPRPQQPPNRAPSSPPHPSIYVCLATNCVHVPAHLTHFSCESCFAHSLCKIDPLTEENLLVYLLAHRKTRAPAALPTRHFQRARLASRPPTKDPAEERLPRPPAVRPASAGAGRLALRAPARDLERARRFSAAPALAIPHTSR